MNISILITFSADGIFLLFTCYLGRSPEDINNITHGYSLIIVVNYEFHTILFLSLDQYVALQCFHIMMLSQYLISYHMYIYLKYFI